jgi:hypothetical protein
MQSMQPLQIKGSIQQTTSAGATSRKKLPDLLVFLFGSENSFEGAFDNTYKGSKIEGKDLYQQNKSAYFVNIRVAVDR